MRDVRFFAVEETTRDSGTLDAAMARVKRQIDAAIATTAIYVAA